MIDRESERIAGWKLISTEAGKGSFVSVVRVMISVRGDVIDIGLDESRMFSIHTT